MRVNAHGREAYSHFKSTPKPKYLTGKIPTEFKYYRTIVNSIWTEVMECFLERDGGVYIEGLGYLTAWVVHNSKYIKPLEFVDIKKRIKHDAMGNKRIAISLVTDENSNKLFKFFSADSTFPRNIFVTKVDQVIVDGRIPKINYKELMQKYKKNLERSKKQKNVSRKADFQMLDYLLAGTDE